MLPAGRPVLSVYSKLKGIKNWMGLFAVHHPMSVYFNIFIVQNPHYLLVILWQLTCKAAFLYSRCQVCQSVVSIVFRGWYKGEL